MEGPEERGANSNSTAYCRNIRDRAEKEVLHHLQATRT
jgi:hypothetical protein